MVRPEIEIGGNMRKIEAFRAQYRRMVYLREAMVDLGPVKEVLFKYIGYIILLGIALILGNLFFKKFEK